MSFCYITMQSLLRGALGAGVVLVATMAFLMALPARELDWEGTLAPLARKYAAATDKPTEASSGYTDLTSLPLDGTIIVVTGATSGIGYALTLSLTTRMGATVVALGRSRSKLDQLEQDVASRSPSSSPLLRTFVVDLADLEDVARVGTEMVQALSHVDILINNAGMHATDDMFAKTASVGQNPAYDRVFVVNYLSHFLLTEKLWPLLQQSTRRYPIVAQMASSFHWAVDGSDLMPRTQEGTNEVLMPIAAQPGGSVGFYLYRTQRSYANSKLAQIWHARSLQRFHGSTKRTVRVVSICPGWVATNIGGLDAARMLDKIAFPKHGWGIASALVAIFDPITEHGRGESVLGDYYINSKIFQVFGLAFPNPTAPWMYQWGLRDGIVGTLAKVALFTQVLAPHAAPAKSSPESYNMAMADELYQWSKSAIAKYI